MKEEQSFKGLKKKTAPPLPGFFLFAVQRLAKLLLLLLLLLLRV
jgi:hypothetical protein